ncbi:MAG TPA: hypothetical protein VGU03_10920 [Frateuria sp.]|uniref:terminase small subunit-like protein n=1 Tax=Frateuria sp. TaxID=2211372 RepID=UPI002DF2B2B2|nr:hypothetical protein [Frateuria sp.]
MAKQPTAKKITKRNGKPAGVRGADRKYDRAKLVPKICARLATGKEPMAVICRDLKVPVRTVNDWRAADPDIAAQFDEARDLGYDAIAHDTLVIADTPLVGVVEKLELVKSKNGRSKLVVTERRNEDMLGHRKLQVETRLKLLAKWDPRRYGDKQQLDHTSSDRSMTPAPAMSKQELREVVQAVTEKF